MNFLLKLVILRAGYFPASYFVQSIIHHYTMGNFMNNQEWRKSNLEQWKSTLMQLFDGYVPDSYTWNHLYGVKSVLNYIGNKKSLAHLFFPHGGGADLMGADYSREDGCIELMGSKGLTYLIKPNYLSFEAVSDDFEWHYFRIETSDLVPTGIYNELLHNHEELVELFPSNFMIPPQYIERSFWDNGYYIDDDGFEKPLPKTARLIKRVFSGSFVIFAKSSIYNATPETYNAIHNNMSAKEFRMSIEEGLKQQKL